ncbi:MULTISPECIES: CsbD family protein [Pediococcus]|uniref:CsbD family protein n=1 Tax=Pediococcus TaxID=1253 RepID=UPI000E8148C7|nr:MULTISPECIES: CsbD family protein [Pediococcus]MCT3029179.1 CsbD family protein [Pediococcus parvulus]HBO47434.1 CsbD family protein [Pediococcus sp.]
MSKANDKLDALKDKAAGKAKGTIGKMTHDDSKELEGKTQKEKGKLKDKAADVKDKAAKKINKHVDDKDNI